MSGMKNDLSPSHGKRLGGFLPWLLAASALVGTTVASAATIQVPANSHYFKGWTFNTHRPGEPHSRYLANRLSRHSKASRRG